MKKPGRGFINCWAVNTLRYSECLFKTFIIVWLLPEIWIYDVSVSRFKGVRQLKRFARMKLDPFSDSDFTALAAQHESSWMGPFPSWSVLPWRVRWSTSGSCSRRPVWPWARCHSVFSGQPGGCCWCTFSPRCLGCLGSEGILGKEKKKLPF